MSNFLTLLLYIIFQHCKPAVDEEGFTRLVERQIEILRRGGNPLPTPGAVPVAAPPVSPSATTQIPENGQPAAPTEEVNMCDR